jgi:hypothetical protein
MGFGARLVDSALVGFLLVFTNFDVAGRLALPVDDYAALYAGRLVGKKKIGSVMPLVMPQVTPELVGFVPDAFQRRLLESEARQVILKCSRQWGKSSVTALKTLLVATAQSDAVVVVMSPSARQSGEFLRKVKGYLAKAGLPKLPTDGVNPMSVLLPNGSRIVALPGVEATMRGFSAVDLLVIDEAAQVRDEQYLAAGPMLAVKNGALWVLSTPYGARGFFWKEWEMGGEGWLRLEVKATDCPRLSAEFLERERLRIGPDWYRQEYLCEFVGAEDGPFREELLQRAMASGVEKLF